MTMGRRLCRLAGLCIVGVVLGAAALQASRQSVAISAAAGPAKSFLVFDATLYKDKPYLGQYHVRPLPILYEHRFWPNPSSNDPVPPESLVRALAEGQRGVTGPVVIDIERWPIKGDPSAVRATVRQFLSVLSWFRDAAPGLRVGLYGTVPVPDYWRAIRDPSSADYRAWQQDNDRLGPIVAQVDALFPSIYTFYPDRQGWVVYAVAQMREARRKANGKPVYAFLWPHYHESNALLRHQPIDPDYWELQLRTVYAHADGVVIWGGWGDNGPEPWNDAAPWWQVTKRFLASISPIGSVPPADITAH